jgi:hypothetical protein
MQMCNSPEWGKREESILLISNNNKKTLLLQKENLPLFNNTLKIMKLLISKTLVNSN